MSKYSIVIPVFNEELVVKTTYERLKNVLNNIDGEYELIFIDDGSTDKTAELIKECSLSDVHVKLLSFSRNFGHQIAISAGIDYADGDAVIIIDADLQDPPEVIPEMIKKWKEGYEIVYGKRVKRKGESIFKIITAFAFYRVLKKITQYDIPLDSGDFRLIDKKVCDVIKKLGEKSRYMRGLVCWVGFKHTFVEYDRDERLAGETKYPFNKMFQFAMDAITSFSYKPLRLASYIGFTISGLSFIYLLVVIYQRFFTDTTIVGWTSVIAVSLFFNGIILVMLGIVGEYIGRIYEEVKDRPLYVLRDKVGF
jgi:dolichol-phosphate mannosyltransferase